MPSDKSMLGCLICNSAKVQVCKADTQNWKIPTGAIYKCSTCGFRWVNPRPSPEINALNFQDEDYYRKVVGKKDSFFRERIKQLQAISQPGKNNLIDIGCGLGEMLLIARDKGFTVTGIEASSYAARFARENNRLDVKNIPIETLPSMAYDIVHSNHVLEHVEDPIQFSKQIFRILKPGGFAFIEVPNEFENLMAKIGLMLHHARFRISPSIHLSFFSPGSMKILLQQAGFNSISLSTRTPQIHNELSAPDRLARNCLRKLADKIILGENLITIGWK